MTANTQHQIQTTYSQKARSYDAWIRGMTLGMETRLRRRLIRRLALHPGDRVLDVACGTGLNFPFIQQAIGPAGRLIGLDLTPAMLAEAGKKIAVHKWRNVTLMEADARAFRLPESVDAALCTLGIGLMPDPGAVVQTMVDSVAPGGRVLISDGRLVDRWYGLLLNPLLRCVGNPWVPMAVRSQYWVACPWKTLAVLTEDFSYQEWLGGALYVTWGNRRKP